MDRLLPRWKADEAGNLLIREERGIDVSWYPDGRLREELTYWSDKFILGDHCKWYDNGVLEYYGYSRFNGKQHRIYYDSRGKKSKESFHDRKVSWVKIYWKGIRIRTIHEKGYKPERRKREKPPSPDDIPWDE